MGQQYLALSDKHRAFIEQQQLFFVGTAAVDGRVNISPKGMDSLRVLDETRVIWLNVTGSGNETATHIQVLPRMTLMFCAFTGTPMILRLYGTARVVHHNDPDWELLSQQLPPLPGARQIFDLFLDLVQSSCGMSVPFFDYVSEREQLSDWARKKGSAGVQDYWLAKNQLSLDGKLTHIKAKNIKPGTA